ncbi:amino acid adenylation domain-containing protein [Flavobacteriaceae bacterium M23B6Z8]
MKELLQKLKEQGIILEESNSKLKVHLLKEDVDVSILEEIKEFKEDLLSFMRSNRMQYEAIPQVAVQESYPISDAQKRLWLSSQIEAESITYNLAANMHLKEDINVDIFTKAVEAVIDRHEILRTVFKKNEAGEVRQMVKSREEIGFKIKYIDYRNEENKTEAVRSFIHEDSLKPFDLEVGPLINAVLLQIEDKEFIFYFNLHHITCDGWSTAILSKEILAYYEALKNNQVPVLKDLSIQYKDYSSWQLSQLNSEIFESHRSFWLENLSGEIQTLDLPSGKARPKQKTSNGRVLETKINADLTHQLKAYSKQNGGSLFMTLLAVWNVLMYRYTSKKDIIIGTPVAGRHHSDLADQIGFYVNTLSLRNQLDPKETFDSFYQKVKQSTLNAFDHQMYPFDRLVEDLKLKRDTSRNLLFDVLFTLQNTEKNPLEETLKSNRLKWSNDKHYRRTLFDIQVTFQEISEELSFEIVYNTDVYDEEMIQRLMLHFEQLASSLLQDASTQIAEVNYLSKSEKEELIYQLNDTSLEFDLDRSIVNLFDEVVTNSPDNVAVVYNEERLSYYELDQRSNQLANYLIREGIATGQVVGLMLDRSIHIPVAIFGVLKAGAAYLPIDPSLPEDRIKFMLAKCNATHLLVTEAYSKFEIEDIPVSIIDAPAVKVTPVDAPSLQTSSSDTAYCIFTSGSSGLPKGVMMTQRSIINLVYGLQTRVYNTIDKEVLNIGLLASYAFDASAQQIYAALLKGHTLFITDETSRKDGKELWNFFNRNKIDVSDGTPTHFRFFVNAFAEETTLESLKAWIIAGEALPKEVVEQFHKIFGSKTQLYNFYGPTETCVDSLGYKIDQNALNQYNAVPIGTPLPNERVYVVDDNGQLVPKGVVGELCIAGEGLALGYVGEEQLTKERFVTDWIENEERVYRTGDLVRWLPDNKLEYIGRLDDQVKIRGYRIELSEIANVIQSHSGVEDAAVLVKDEEQDKSLVAYVVPHKDRAHTVRNILNEQKDETEGDAELYELDNGISLYSYNRSEAKMLYTEVFESKSYYSNGIKMPKDATIIDIGANVGSFSIFAAVMFENPIIYAFEPLSPTYKLLEKNTNLYKGKIKTFNIGISDKEEEAIFNFYPHATTLSGRASLGDGIQHEVKRFIDNTRDTNEQDLTADEVNDLLDNRLAHEKYNCKLKSLSQVIEENSIDHIHLLKIDAENAEMDIIRGINDKDWAKIDQMIIEVYDGDGSLKTITEILEKYNFKVSVNQNEELKGTQFYNVYAIATKEIVEGSITEDFASRNWYGVNALNKSLKEMLTAKLPEYMVPSEVVLLENLPVTANGKLDREKLLSYGNNSSSNKVNMVMPQSETEKVIAAIWADVLKIDQEAIGIHTDFFDLGGHSLKGIQIANQIKQHFGITLKLADLFNKRTIAEIAEVIEMQQWLDNETLADTKKKRKEAVI